MDNRLFFSATQRNRDCIGNVLSRIIKKGSVLEIGSGSGEHGVVFQKRFPRIIWQTSDPELVHRKSISSWIEYEGLTKKMPQPLEIDVEKIPWKIPKEFFLHQSQEAEAFSLLGLHTQSKNLYFFYALTLGHLFAKLFLSLIHI